MNLEFVFRFGLKVFFCCVFAVDQQETAIKKNHEREKKERSQKLFFLFSVWFRQLHFIFRENITSSFEFFWVNYWFQKTLFFLKKNIWLWLISSAWFHWNLFLDEHWKSRKSFSTRVVCVVCFKNLSLIQ